MLYYNPCWFKIELLPTAIMDFIAKTPPDCYFLVSVGENLYYGMVVSEDIIEYLLNEFHVKSFEVLQSEQIKKVLFTPTYKFFGNQELLNWHN